MEKRKTESRLTTLVPCSWVWAHPYQEFRGVPPPPPPGLLLSRHKKRLPPKALENWDEQMLNSLTPLDDFRVEKYDAFTHRLRSET